MKNKIINSFIKTIKKPWSQVDEQTTTGYVNVNNLIELSCNHLPKLIKKSLFSFIQKISMFLSKFLLLISQFSLTIYKVQGKEKHSKEKLTILFLSKENPYPYPANILFSKKPKIETIGEISIRNIKKKLDNLSSEIDAVFIKTDKFYSIYFEKQGFTVIPEWISMTVDTSEDYKKIYKNFTKSAKEDVRKVKKYGYTYEISGDYDKLKFFYDKMYLPYMNWRHREAAVLSNFHALRLLFETNGKLMMIKRDDEYVFGAMFSVIRDKVIAIYAGVIVEKAKLLKKGAGAASYYFLLQWAKENGIKLVDFGSCRPFLNTGVFQYKRKWGTTISKTDSPYHGVYAFKSCKDSKAFQSFLINNPFVYLENNQLKIINK
jgi:hypothetical protein